MKWAALSFRNKQKYHCFTDYVIMPLNSLTQNILKTRKTDSSVSHLDKLMSVTAQYSVANDMSETSSSGTLSTTLTTKNLDAFGYFF